MRGFKLRAFALSFGLSAVSLQAGEPVWKPAGAPQQRVVESSSFGSGVSLGRPVPVAVGGSNVLANPASAATLDRPVPLTGGPRTIASTSIFDRDIRPVAFYGPSPEVTAYSARGQSPDLAQPMPFGPAQLGVSPSPPAAADKPPVETINKMPTPAHTIASTPITESKSSPLKPSPSGGFEQTCGDGSVLFFDDPNCSTCGPDFCVVPGRFWVRGEYLLWWMKNPNAPALVTTGNTDTLGALGPGTTVLFGGGELDSNERSGGRFTTGFWWDPCHRWGLEGSFFFLGQRTTNFVAASGGVPILARPFFNADPAVNAEDAERVANPFIPVTGAVGTLPLSGRVGVTTNSKLWGTELNALCNITQRECSRLDWITGFRYIQLDDNLGVTENLLVPAGSPLFAGTGFIVADRFSSRDQFYGPQIGLKAELLRGRWQLDLTTKVALGVTHEIVNIGGSTQVIPAGGAATVFPGGLLAQPTNSGRFSQDNFAVAPEVGINLGYNVTPHCRLLLGYNFLYLSHVVRASEQIDRVVNATQLTGGTLVGPARPAFAFNSTDFWAHGLNFGLEWKF